MRIKVCVPSKGRAEFFYKKTFQIVKELGIDWAVFVEPQERKLYGEFVPSDNLQVIPQNNRGLGYALNYIKRHCKGRRYTYCLKLDDDIHHVYSHDQQRVSSKAAQAKMIEDVITSVLMPAHKLFGPKLGGISFPNKLFHTNWRKYTHVNKMFESLYIIRTNQWFTPISSKGYNEEPFASAYLLNNGLITLRTGRMAWNLDMSTASGGLQMFDREKEHQEKFLWMQKHFPEITALLEPRQYTQKSGVTFTVVDKREYNRNHSSKLPIKSGYNKLDEKSLVLLTKLPRD